VTWLLDTSALLVFLLDEPEADTIESLLFDSQRGCAVSFASWVEVQGRLKALGLAREEIEAQMADARRLPMVTLWVDELVLQKMIELKAPAYFPFANAFIAATASVNQLALVHKDPHFASLPADIAQLDLRPARPA
jgi:predicted nucleic acid-binding protein